MTRSSRRRLFVKLIAMGARSGFFLGFCLTSLVWLLGLRIAGVA